MLKDKKRTQTKRIEQMKRIEAARTDPQLFALTLPASWVRKTNTSASYRKSWGTNGSNDPTEAEIDIEKRRSRQIKMTPADSEELFEPN